MRDKQLISEALILFEIVKNFIRHKKIRILITDFHESNFKFSKASFVILFSKRASILK